MKRRKPSPDFEIYFRARYPEEVPVRSVADVISAIESLFIDAGHPEPEVSLVDGGPPCIDASAPTPAPVWQCSGISGLP